MLIDDKTYQLSINNYTRIESIKKMIVLGHTFNNEMKHVKGWMHRYNGTYKKTAAYTISSSGAIYQHFDPKFQSTYFNDKELDKKSIIILLENDGWLQKDLEKNVFITWIGDIYKQSSEVVEKKWRGHKYWSPYTTEQIESTLKLVNLLCDEFNIPIITTGHNTKIEDSYDYRGVIFKSNLERYYTDLSPSFDCEDFKNKLEIK